MMDTQTRTMSTKPRSGRWRPKKSDPRAVENELQCIHRQGQAGAREAGFPPDQPPGNRNHQIESMKAAGASTEASQSGDLYVASSDEKEPLHESLAQRRQQGSRDRPGPLARRRPPATIRHVPRGRRIIRLLLEQGAQDAVPPQTTQQRKIMARATKRARQAMKGATALWRAAWLPILNAIPAPSAAGRVIEVSDFGPNPGGLRMFVYAPPKRLPTGAPLIVVLHGCGQNALLSPAIRVGSLWPSALARRFCCLSKRAGTITAVVSIGFNLATSAGAAVRRRRSGKWCAPRFAATNPTSAGFSSLASPPAPPWRRRCWRSIQRLSRLEPWLRACRSARPTAAPRRCCACAAGTGSQTGGLSQRLSVGLRLQRVTHAPGLGFRSGRASATGLSTRVTPKPSQPNGAPCMDSTSLQPPRRRRGWGFGAGYGGRPNGSRSSYGQSRTWGTGFP